MEGFFFFFLLEQFACRSGVFCRCFHCDMGPLFWVGGDWGFAAVCLDGTVAGSAGLKGMMAVAMAMRERLQ